MKNSLIFDHLHFSWNDDERQNLYIDDIEDEENMKL